MNTSSPQRKRLGSKWERIKTNALVIKRERLSEVKVIVDSVKHFPFKGTTAVTPLHTVTLFSFSGDPDPRIFALCLKRKDCSCIKLLCFFL